MPATAKPQDQTTVTVNPLPDRCQVACTGQDVIIHLDSTIAKRLRLRAGRQGETDARFAEWLWNETLKRALETTAY